ncbi:proton channel OTOP2 [Hemicordylus capensis]|uniref:proton channel OTOP2 n=1 Tax=Hemicordylus capensis TaxID=884348 RepID=UPI0023039BF9|nr:proton channel OTOP2 [Hemicordylus capensis]
MTEDSVWNDTESIRREDSIMGSSNKDDKGNLGPDPLSPISHHKFPLAVPHNPKDIWKKGGRVFSVLLAINLVLLSCTLVSGGAFEEVHVYDYDVFFMLTIVMVITIAWMLFYLLNTSRHQNAILCKDSHAGPIWLRGGLAFFAILTLVMGVFKTGYYSSFSHCLSAIKITYPIVQALFVIIQTYFLWVSAKDCVHVHLDVTRCGLMLTLTTNLAVWMSAVTDESVHKAQMKLPNSTHRIAGMKAGSTKCPCSGKLCKIFQDGYYWLYPFNIEYSLFASAMVYIMWKNVGRLIDQHTNHIHHLKFKFFKGTYFLGVITGLLIVMLGLAVLIVYEIRVNMHLDSKAKNEALSIYYIFNIICLSLTSLASIGGSIVYRFDKRVMDHDKNPTRTLDVALLMGAALGQYAISYYSIVAIVANKTSRDQISALNLSYSLLMIAQHTFQNIFIIEGLHRQPPEEEDKTDPQQDIYGLTFVNVNAVSLCVPESALPSATPPALAIQSSSEVTQSIKVSKKMHWRRRFLKEISLFLLLCNVILWIMPAFGARPQFDNTQERRFYGDSMWAAIVDICLPFGIFYRMHAVASLLEVYIMS